MDTKKVFPSPTISKRERRSWVLSYRRYKRLTEEEKNIFDSSRNEYTPNEWKLALQIKATTKKPFRAHFFKLAHKWVTEAEHYYMEHGFPGYCIESYIDSKYLAKQFEFEGFIPLYKYKRFAEGFCYIISTKPYGGTFWIYPKKFISGMSYGGRHKNLWSVYGTLGISGCTFARQNNYKIYRPVEKELEKISDSRNPKTIMK